MRTILERIHFGELTTIYPPVSQAVFALATATTPTGSPIVLRLTIMKAWFVGFDLATLGLVIALLRFTGRPLGWSLAYGWCPLVVKEVAGSGHLDALAVCLATLAAYLAVLALYRGERSSLAASTGSWARSLLATAAALALALAVGAKLYPLVLAPLFLFSFVRRLGPRAVADGAGGAACLSTGTGSRVRCVR
jgi:hypothetical protein